MMQVEKMPIGSCSISESAFSCSFQIVKWDVCGTIASNDKIDFERGITNRTYWAEWLNIL